ncbi:MAG: metal ABC transporter permease [Verrucomicrobiae bacterium]|nr:metal ABC transporter permease [Verrucomicrobiae bacterium]
MTLPCHIGKRAAALAGFALLFLLLASPVHAARIHDVSDAGLWDHALRFFSLKDPTIRLALAGCVLLGLCCGLLGTFIVVRQFALLGDTLAHAVLPGIALGYLWTLSKQPLHLFVGAVGAGILGTVMVSLIRDTTRLKRDAALGIVLGGFYGTGILLVTLIQKLPGDKSGLKSFLFGSAAALSEGDVILIAVVALVAVLILGVFFPHFRIASFDPTFATSIGIPSQAMHYLLMLLLAWAVVSALQAVGVVLVSALLIIPAATAYLLTDRLHLMAWLAMGFGMLSGAAGAFLSALKTGLPTGPFVVLSASALFAGAFLFAPQYGFLPRWLRQRRQAGRIRHENTLKAIYHLLEGAEFTRGSVARTSLISQRGRSEAEVDREIAALVANGLAEPTDAEGWVRLTTSGRARAAEIVRNHRLWELFLTNAANIAPDHVHDDAEKIEHVLGEDIVRKLELALDLPTEDPHGKSIPVPPEDKDPWRGRDGDGI